MKILIIICLFISASFAQEINFAGKGKVSLEQLKKNFKVHEVEVFNFYIRRLETYYAFSLKEILNNIYSIKWKNYSHIKVEAHDQYIGYIDVFKFRFSVPFLAFKKKYSSNFQTVLDYNEVLDLGDFFIIWKENYKEGDLKRTHHWVYKVKEIELLKNLPLKIMPEQIASEEIFDGYVNYVDQCIQCHAIDDFGGKRSYNIFKENILQKSDKYLMRFISHPRYFKKGSKMPPFPLKITKRTSRIKNIMKYIRYISSRDFDAFEKSLPTNEESRDKLYRELKTKIDNL